MATTDGIYYWKYWGSTSDTTSGTSGDWCEAGGTTNYYVGRVIRKYLVISPEAWGEEATAGFVSLLNDKTNTGFVVEMVIRGEVRITDPTIEIRTMEDFVPLLRNQAGKADWTKIKKFFKKYGDK